MNAEWATRIKVLLISALIASIGNVLCTWHAGKIVSPLESIPPLLAMVAIALIGCLIQQLLEKALHFHLPTIIYISLLTTILSVPGLTPIAGWMASEFAKIGLLPLCTPILAYAGISIGPSIDDFRKQGIGIVLTALGAFFGTFIGSAIIAQIILSATGVI